MKLHKVQQQSKEWFDLKVKHPLSASRAQAIGNQGQGLDTLCWTKTAEKYSSADRENYTNKDLMRGIELEPEARSIYELTTGNEVLEVGCVTDDEISDVALVSPDGLVGDDGLVEIKCFADTKHFKMTVKGLEIESQYMWQMQMQLLFTGRKWVDFVAYNPNYKKALLIKRVTPDKEMQQKLVDGLRKGEELIKEIKQHEK